MNFANNSSQPPPPWAPQIENHPRDIYRNTMKIQIMSQSQEPGDPSSVHPWTAYTATFRLTWAWEHHPSPAIRPFHNVIRSCAFRKREFKIYYADPHRQQPYAISSSCWAIPNAPYDAWKPRIIAKTFLIDRFFVLEIQQWTHTFRQTLDHTPFII